MINKNGQEDFPVPMKSAIAEPLQLRWGSVLTVALILIALQSYKKRPKKPEESKGKSPQTLCFYTV